MAFLRLIKYHLAVASALLLALPFVPAVAQNAPVVPSYGSAWNPDYQTLQLMGGGTNGVLSVSSTYQFCTCIGHAGIITGCRVGAITQPSATSDVTIQFFKNSTSNAITGIYDLNGVASGTSVLIPITGNNTLATNDIVIAQVITGASIGGAAGVTACVQSRTVTYSNGTSF